MTAYVMLIDDGIRPVEPYEIELANLQAARVEAARLLGAMINDEPEDFWPEDFWKAMDWRLSVQDETGRLLFELYAGTLEAPAVQRRNSS